MFSLPSIGFSLYPEDAQVQPPVSTFKSVGTAAFPHIVSAPSPFMASPVFPSKAGTEKPAPKNEREGLGLFSQPGTTTPAGSEFVLPQASAAASAPIPPEVFPTVSIADFNALQSRVKALEDFSRPMDPRLLAALQRVSELEEELNSIQEHLFRDPFQGLAITGNIFDDIFTESGCGVSCGDASKFEEVTGEYDTTKEIWVSSANQQEEEPYSEKSEDDESEDDELENEQDVKDVEENTDLGDDINDDANEDEDEDEDEDEGVEEEKGTSAEEDAENNSLAKKVSK